MKPRNSERTGKAVQQATLDKRQERVLCFLGFASRYQCLPDGRNLCLDLCLNYKLFGVYLEYLEKVRQSAPGTIAEAITSAIFVCKWLYRKCSGGLETSGSSVVRRYKDWRNEHQNRAQRLRKMVDQEDLEERNQWLDWSEFTALVSRLKQEWESTSPPSMQNAHKLHDLLLLGLYSCIPSRGAEVRLLQYIPHEELAGLRRNKSLKQYVDSQRMNLITQVNDGTTWKMVLGDFKNVRSHGVDSTNLTQFEWWTDLLQLYLGVYRPLLVTDYKMHRYVFVTRSGDSFTSNYFSDFISSLLFRHTGKRVATNGLRSSFVTSFYDSEAANDPVMRESVANVMRHSVAEAKRTYDRRSGTSKKRKGLDLLALVATNGVRTEKKQHTDGVPAVVVECQRLVYKVITEDNTTNQMLLAKMERSSHSNAPLYYVPLNVVYEHHSSTECHVLTGSWQDADFLLN